MLIFRSDPYGKVRILILTRLNHIILFCAALTGLALVSGCSSDSTTSVNPEVYSPVYPDTLYRNAGPFYIEVRVRDPQGLDDISTVEFRMDHIGSGTAGAWSGLFDSGSGGDSTSGDGRFAKLVQGLTSNDSTGQYILKFRAVDRGNHQSNALEESLLVSQNELPQLSDPSTPDTIYSDLTDEVLITVMAADPNGNGQIDSVWLEFFRPDGSTNGLLYRMYDDGSTEGDVTAGDSIYSVSIRSDDFDLQYGTFRIEFNAVDNAGGAAQAVEVNVHVMPQSNEPPALLNLVAPDTIQQKVPPDTIFISVVADDRQGLDDVDSVWYRTYRPDGSLSKDTSYYLYDDGTHGDSTSGDGTFTSGILSPPPDPSKVGDWRFEFWSRDIHGAVSDSLDKYIYLKY